RSSSSEIEDGAVMEVEVVGGRAHRAVDDAFVLRGDVFERTAHVQRGQLRRMARRSMFCRVMTMTFSFSNLGDRAKRKRPGGFPAFDCMWLLSCAKVQQIARGSITRAAN